MGRPKIPLESKDKKKLSVQLDDTFSIFIRLSWANSDGLCTCFSCGKKIFWKYITNGHWITRGVYQLRYDEDNCRPQCAPCNGDMTNVRFLEFERSLQEELGEQRIAEMKAIAIRHQAANFEKEFYIEKIHYYEEKIAGFLKLIPSIPPFST